MTIAFTGNQKEAGHSRPRHRSAQANLKPAERPAKPLGAAEKSSPTLAAEIVLRRILGIQPSPQRETASPPTSNPHSTSRPHHRA